MNQRVLHSLEFTKVLSYLAGFAVSEAGQKACLLLRPLDSLDAIHYQAAFFDQGRSFLSQSKTFSFSFPPIDDFLNFLDKTQALPELDALWALRRVLAEAKALMDAIGTEESLPHSHWPLLQERCARLVFPAKIFSALSRCLSDDGLIRDAASPELSLVRGELRRLHQHCTRKVKQYATDYNIMHFLQDDFMTLSSDRYVLPLKTNFKGRLQGVVHDYSQTGETCYFEPLFLVEINNRLQELKREEREEERKILLYLGSLVREEMIGIRAAYDLLVDMDVLQARSALAACYDGRVVDLNDDASVCLREARHPLLALAFSKDAEKALRAYKKASVALAGTQPDSDTEAPLGQKAPVATTLELRPGEQALIISGGNAGGKTVALKTLGLVALMSKAALPVPVAAGSSLPFWKRVHAFIGDEQSLEDHVSTFTAQITHLSRIWPGLGPGELVILDEFGAGTDPAQGAALAQAVIDRLMAHKVHVLAATHFPALKAYALSTEGVRSASVLFDPSTKKPLFRLVYEQVGASLALDVAREHGLPAEVLDRADEYLLTSGSDTSSLVARLNALAVEREMEIASLQKKQAAYLDKKEKLTARFEEDRKKLFGSIQANSQSILEEWKKGKISHRQALKDLGQIKTQLQPRAEEAAPALAVDIAALEVGQSVFHAPWNRAGLVQEVDTRKNRVRLSLDGLSLWAGCEALRLAPDAGKKTARPTPSGTAALGTPKPQMLFQLDLRGKRADVAIADMVKFLDDAVLQGQYSVAVVHGRGTGVLRRELHKEMRVLPCVASFRLAPEDQGGDGMTIVELK